MGEFKKGGNPLWVKGVSGNPSGRPKGIAQMIRDRTADLSIQVNELIRLSRESKSEKVRLEAIGMLFDRVLGRALETHVTADLGAEAKLALLEGLTLTELAELARPARAVGSIEVVEPSAPALHLPETTVLKAEGQGSREETPLPEAEAITPKPE